MNDLSVREILPHSKRTERVFYLIVLSVWMILFGIRLQQTGGIIANFTKSNESQTIFSHWEDVLSSRVGLYMPQPQSDILNGMLLGLGLKLPNDLNTALKKYLHYSYCGRIRTKFKFSGWVFNGTIPLNR